MKKIRAVARGKPHRAGKLYKLTFPNGKAYIGITSYGVVARYADHQSRALLGRPYLVYHAWRKYGAPIIRVLAIIEIDLLNDIEVKAIASYRTLTPHGYNMTEGGEGFRGMKRLPEHIAKHAAALRIRMLSPEIRAKAGAANRGRIHSVETLAKMSASLRGHPTSLETRAKIGAAHRGSVHSPEARAKMSVAARLRTASPETRANMCAAQRKRRAKEGNICVEKN